MNNELDIVKLVKNLRYLKILVKNSFINEKIKIMIMNLKKNAIDIDNQSDSKIIKNSSKMIGETQFKTLIGKNLESCESNNN